MIQPERRVSADNWYHGDTSTDEQSDPNGVHDCVLIPKKPIIVGPVIDFLRDKDGVPITSPDGEPWFIEIYPANKPLNNG